MIRRFIKFIFSTVFWICAVVGFLILLLGISLYFLIGSETKNAPLKHPSVLAITLNGTYVEHTDPSGIQALILGKDASLYNLTRSIYHAAQDDKIKGLVIRLESPSLGIAQIQELREALLSFRKSGKPSWFYSDTFGEISSGTPIYYLATACNEIWIQPLGIVSLTGLHLELPFAKKSLEMLGVKPEIVQRKDYKSYPEMFTREDFSEPSKEALQAILDSILSQLVDGIAKERKLSHDQVRLLIEEGPFLLKEIQKAHLIDRVDFRQNLKPTIQKKLGDKIKFVGVKSYLKTIHSSKKEKNIALIFGSGTIERDGEKSPWEEMKITSNLTYEAFQKAIKDKDVKVIVYRINSGGGSPVASETIRSLVREAQEKAKKPVIISMSDYAASGGYWISCAGTKIVAQPATLTGSIGVFGGKFVLSGLFEKLGLHWGHISTSDNANMWSMNQPYSPNQWVKLNAQMDEIYNEFIARVANDRNMTPEQVEKVARGRVWTGEQALALGLVDDLGGLQKALELARKEVNLPIDAGIKIYPHPKTFLETFSDLLEDKEEDPKVQSGLLGSFLSPFKKAMSLFNRILSSQDTLYTPLGEVK